MQVVSRFYSVNNVTLHVKEAGNTSSPAILFLHGFPSFWYSWQAQINFFAAKDYHVIVPDQRGYNESTKPVDINDYRLTILVEDIVQLLFIMNVKQTCLAAHDWGGIVAWALLKKHPDLIVKAVIINAPYLPAYAKFSFSQLIRSWYVFFFQLRRLPEWLLKRNNFSVLADMMITSSLPNTFSQEDIFLYKQAWQKGNSLTAMINWYRAIAKYRKDTKAIFGVRKPIEVPVLVLWGMKDNFLKKESGICPSKHCTYFAIKEYEDATHWLPMEKSEEVNEEILHFITI